MIIKIPDTIEGIDRKRLLLYYPILYSMFIHQNRITKAAEWLGITRRSLFDILRRHPELRSFLNKKIDPDNGLLPDDRHCEKHPLDKIFDNHLSKTQQSFWWNNCTTEAKMEFIERLKKLYSMYER